MSSVKYVNPKESLLYAAMAVQQNKFPKNTRPFAYATYRTDAWPEPWDMHISAPCYASIGYGRYQTADRAKTFPAEIVITNPGFHHHASNRGWIEWLLSDLCPWKEYIDKQIAATRGLEPDPWSLEYIFEHGFLCPDLDYPSNFQMNFWMGARQPEEWDPVRETFNYWTQRKIHPSLAFVITDQCVYWDAAKSFSERHFAGGHYPLNTSLDTYKNFLARTPQRDKFLQSYLTRQAYMPCNVVWGGIGDWQNPTTLEVFLKQINVNTVGKTGRFGSNNVHFTEAEWLDIMKRLQDFYGLTEQAEEFYKNARHCGQSS